MINYYEKTISKMKEIQETLQDTKKMMQVAFALYFVSIGILIAMIAQGISNA